MGPMKNADKKKGKKDWNKKKNPKKKSTKDEDEEGFEEVSSALTEDALTFQEDVADMGMDSDEEMEDTRKLIQQQNRKNKKSGGFQSMGLSHVVFKGITRKGYKVPTPIQRKAIPIIMDGKDVVAMARTGSGKTAAFLIPVFEKLKVHSAQSGARALILSPTRELALQTLKFTKEIGKYTGLKAAVILGGDRIDDQFSALHENPDIIIATPGRFMHVLVEMELKLNSVEYIVFDEADRLFEMGFHEQLQEILSRVPENRQTLLFSATLPKLLVDFAKAGLHDPTLIRLDVDSKLSELLKLSFLQCRHEDRTAILLYLLRNVVKPSEQTVVFVATKHHVEFLNMVLREAGIKCSYIYSSLDQTARKIHVAKFRNKITSVLLVTDLAARGIDIPMLDNVINFNFPAKPKLFVHRVGRVARAGRSGTAYSLVSPDEMPFVLDLHLFLGRPVKTASSTMKGEDDLIGRVPQSIIDDEDANLRIWGEQTDLANMKRVIDNAYKNYIRSRPSSSSESVKRFKAMKDLSIAYHPLFVESGGFSPDLEGPEEDLLEKMRNYKTKSTIFEINPTKKGSSTYEIMRNKRTYHGNAIVYTQKKKELKEENQKEAAVSGEKNLVPTSETEVHEVFSHIVDQRPKNKKRQQIVDEEHYLSYRPKDQHSEKGLGLGTSFDLEAQNATLDLAGDDEKQSRSLNNNMKWDRKKKKFVREDNNEGKKKKVKTESGHWVKASYKANLYKDWLEKNKMSTAGDENDDDDSDDDEPKKKKFKPTQSEDRLKVFGYSGFRGRGYHNTKAKPEPQAKGPKPKRHELKNKDQILKHRRQKAKLENFQKHRGEMRKGGQGMGGRGGGRGGRGGGRGGRGGKRR